ncbi:DUF3606 domain-containing protein [Chelatococcus reniformis]|uniref:DUF3606 domain-containing protein n=1 Tax=Chelatococcus reniformis TaxID=1494448 RepID=A0A916UR65_9HYPH|nr:DUF3606 domain-containing protein [Chelatococcus reniformis]GGC82983.1 hypothetical protein GCM10010994_46090 [Chelatococcus reniformis]
MPDDRTKVGAADRASVAANEDYEIDDLAQKHDLTRQQVLDLISAHGNSREKLDAAAEELKRTLAAH